MPDDTTPSEEIHKDSLSASLAAAGGTPAAGAPSVGAGCADPVAGAVLEKFAGSVFDESHGQAVVYLDRAHWHDAAAFLRDEQQFTQCVDIAVVDHLADEIRRSIEGVAPERFEVVANFLSHPRNRRLRLICEVPDGDTTVASITDLYPGVSFSERESYDLFGITFDGHPDLTRILMPEDWVGYPLRKDDAPGRVPVAFKGNPSPR